MEYVKTSVMVWQMKIATCGSRSMSVNWGRMVCH